MGLKSRLVIDLCVKEKNSNDKKQTFSLNKTGNSIYCFPCCSGNRLTGFWKAQFVQYGLLIRMLHYGGTNVRLTVNDTTQPIA